MRKLLIVNLYDGNNEIEMVDEEEMREIERNCEKGEGEKMVWLAEEHIYIEL